MTTENKGVLSFISGLSILVGIMFSVALGIMSIISLIILFVMIFNPSFGPGLIKSIYGSSSGNWFNFILMDISLLLTLVFSAIIAFSIFKVIKNVRSGIYFNESNLNYFKRILQCFSGLVFINFLSSLLFNIFRISISVTGDNNIQELGIIMWVIMYVIYIVFKQGLVLKNTNDKFI